MTPAQMQTRLKEYALRILRLVRSFPRGMEADVIGRQLIRSGTSVAANYRACCKARSKADFVSKLGIVAEEADESVFWIDFAADAGLAQRPLVADLIREGEERTSIVVASKRTAKARMRRTD